MWIKILRPTENNFFYSKNGSQIKKLLKIVSKTGKLILLNKLKFSHFLSEHFLQNKESLITRTIFSI